MDKIFKQLLTNCDLIHYIEVIIAYSATDVG